MKSRLARTQTQDAADVRYLSTPTVTKKGVTSRKGPSAVQMGANFASALASHVKAGRPQATDEEVAERFAICQKCDLFEPKKEGHGKCLHKSCGCSLKAVGISGLNKLRWADQSCPLGLWLAISKDKSQELGK